MRIKLKEKPYIRQIRYKSFFALLPIKIKNEVRFLEKVCVRQVYDALYGIVKWINLEFIDDVQSKN